MDFTFSEDQLLFQQSVREFLVNEVTTEKIRSLWPTDTGRSVELWRQLADMGLTGITVPEDFGGLGMTVLDFVLLAEECGYVALPEPLVMHAMVAVPLLAGVDDDALKAEWLPKLAAGDARVAVGLAENLLVEDAHVADLLLLEHDGEIHAVTRAQARLTFNESVDPSRRLFSVEWKPSAATCVAAGIRARTLLDNALNAGAVGAAAQALGLTRRMLDMSVKYTSEREQFGKPVGSFQAVKHHLASVAVRWEYAKAPVYRAAYSVANKQPFAAVAVSHAKLAACEAAEMAAKSSIQVHGAMGYTWEVDLHIFMKKAWALSNTWGDAAAHKLRVADFVFADGAAIGAGHTFGD